MTILGRSEELVSRCVECDLAEPESLASLGCSAPGVVDGILLRGLLLRPSDVPGWRGVRPGGGKQRTDGCCGRERVVGGVDGVPVLCSTRRKQARCNCIRRLHCSNSNCSSRSSKSRSSTVNESSWFLGGVIGMSLDKSEDLSLLLLSPCIDTLDHGIWNSGLNYVETRTMWQSTTKVLKGKKQKHSNQEG